MSPFDLEELYEKLRAFDGEIEKEGFWDDHEYAQKVLKDKKVLENKIDEFKSLESSLEELELMIELAEEEEEIELLPEIEASYKAFNDKLESVRIKTMLDGEYDLNNAILSIHSGAGLDAQDWAEMSLGCIQDGQRIRTIKLLSGTFRMIQRRHQECHNLRRG